MTQAAAQLLDQIKFLPEKERANLAYEILCTLEPGDENQAEVDAAWAEEVDRRIEEMESGKVIGIPAEEVFKKLRERMK